MLKIALLLVVLPALVLGGRIKISACKNGGPMPNYIEVDNCDEKECVVYNLVPVNMNGEITTKHSAQDLTVSLKAFLSIIELPMELPEDMVDGCQAIERNCPVAVNETRGIATTFIVDSPFADITPDIELSIHNELNELVMCVRTTVTLRATPAV